MFWILKCTVDVNFFYYDAKLCFTLLFYLLLILTVCDSRRFGVGCKGICYCAASVPCDPVNGTCPSGCEQGFEGQTCSAVAMPEEARMPEAKQGEYSVYYIICRTAIYLG